MKLILPSGDTITASPHFSLLDNLKKGGIHIIAPCGGGSGICGRCKVIVKEGPYRTRLKEKLSDQELADGYVVACQTFLKGDLKIEVPPASLLSTEGAVAAGKAEELAESFNSYQVAIQPLTIRVDLELPKPTLTDNVSDTARLKRGLAQIGYAKTNFPYRLMRELARNLREANWSVTVVLVDMDYGKEIVRLRPGAKGEDQGKYGLAVDVGTTTVVVYLVDLLAGRLVDSAATYNYQIIYGEDVISRIIYATDKGGLKELQDIVIDNINNLIESVIDKYSLAEECIDSIVISGNTTMTQLLLGLDPAWIRLEPYIPTANNFPITSAGRLGINVMPDAPLYTMPCVASYVGGDIVAGVLATKMHKSDDLSILIDVGTNGELVIGNSEWLITTACSAGPCFEGGGLKYGMRATQGAIDSVRVNPHTFAAEITVIGGGVPDGVCGSGIIDAIAELFLAGVITPKGQIRTDLGLKNFRSTASGGEYILYQNENKIITITEPDIDNILRAKSAIYAGFKVMLREVGLSFEDISNYYIAGGFGRFLHIDKAIIIGMLPDQPREKFKYFGNTSATGAYLCLLSAQLRREAEDVANKMTYLELSVSRQFMDEYVAGMFLPHTDLAAFPSVAELTAT